MWDECAIVDDNKFDRLICKRILSRVRKGINVLEFESAIQCLEFLRKDYNPAKPLMIFLDLNMPEMSGLEFLSAFDQDASQALKKDSVSIHIMSSSTRISDIEAANRFSYVEGFIQKPMNVDQLKKVVG